MFTHRLICSATRLVFNMTRKPIRQLSGGPYREPESSSLLQTRLGLNEDSLFGICGRGSPYETKVKRRRQVKDLSIPKFEEVECLKWATWWMLRDVKRRHYYEKYWQCRTNLQNIRRNRTLPNLVREIATEERLLTPRYSSVSHIINRCAVSGRTRGKFRRYRLSRMIWRDMADHGLLSGFIRAKWG